MSGRVARVRVRKVSAKPSLLTVPSLQNADIRALTDSEAHSELLVTEVTSLSKPTCGISVNGFPWIVSNVGFNSSSA